MPVCTKRAVEVGGKRPEREEISRGDCGIHVPGCATGRGADLLVEPAQGCAGSASRGVPSESKIIQARQQVREMSQDALASLYEIAPGTRRTIERSGGYAVFSTFGVKLFFAGGTTGKGIVVNQRTQRQTFNLPAMAGGQGTQFSGAAAVSPGVYLYQLTQTGLSATLTVGGTKYFKDGDLN